MTACLAVGLPAKKFCATARDHLRAKRTRPCYLCGQPLAEPTNRDHYPPKQFFAARIIAENPNLQFKTHRVHESCNTAYKHDEDYFVQTFMPFVRGSYAGNALYEQALDTYRKGHNVGLVRKVLGQFERKPSGLILPAGKSAMRFERTRTDRILWKIVRALFFEHFGRALPHDLRIYTNYVVGDDEEPPQHFMQFMAELNPPAHGPYPGVFSYRFAELPVANGDSEKPYYFALLLWDKFLFTVFFHDDGCPCEVCALS